MKQNRRVLVAGIVLAQAENLAQSIIENFAGSREWDVDQKWVSIGEGNDRLQDSVIAEVLSKAEPKFTILNRILAGAPLPAYDYAIVVDDDIELPHNFIDRYLALADRYDLALAQPARTHDSYIDHPFVEQLDGIVARQTRFVEIGPLFSIRADAFPLLLPFDLTSPMGWGYDLAWPVTMAAAGLKSGIIDALPVSHNLRKPVSSYDREDVVRQMSSYRANHEHLKPEEAFFIIESFSQ